MAAGASAKTTRFRGPIEPAGTLSFELTRKPDLTRLRNGFRFRGLPVDCAGGRSKSSGHLTFPIKVEQRRFTATAKSRHGAASLLLRGRFNEAFSHATGTIEIRGRKVPLDSGGTGRCHSGTRHFDVRQV